MHICSCSFILFQKHFYLNYSSSQNWPIPKFFWKENPAVCNVRKSIHGFLRLSSRLLFTIYLIAIPLKFDFPSPRCVLFPLQVMYFSITIHNALQFLTLAIETIECMFYQEKKKPEIVSGPTSYHFFSPINRHICHRECKYSASPHTRRCPSQT